ncbi:MAG: helix-turn-helix domain-containing protein [Kineosporiaceae bacterium]|nr:helix-turn-helix domain-containing protein [Aeromicrobium sp.]
MSPLQPVDPRVRLAIAQWPDDAPRGSVTTFCLEHGLSRKTFYAIRKRAQLEGQAAALQPRSRRPAVSPNRISEDVKAQAIGVRAALEQSGFDLRALDELLISRVNGRTDRPLRRRGLEELQPIAERVVRVNTPEAGEVSVPADGLACFDQSAHHVV